MLYYRPKECWTCFDKEKDCDELLDQAFEERGRSGYDLRNLTVGNYVMLPRRFFGKHPIGQCSE